MRVIHQRKKCIGCGSCAALCPKIFKMDDGNRAIIRGEATVFNSEKGEQTLVIEMLGCIKEAADVCPAQCIIINKN